MATRAAHLRERGFIKLLETNNDRDNPGKLTLDRNQPGSVDLWVTQGAMAGDIARSAGIPAIKEVFSAILSQDYWLACSKEMPRETIRALSGALAGMKKDGTHRKLTTLPRNN